MPLSAAQTFVYIDDFAERVQMRLDEPNVWKEVCEVQYSDIKNLHFPYVADITLQSNTRSSPYTFQALTETDETLEIAQVAIAPWFVSAADKAQKSYADYMDLADHMTSQIDENIETFVWKQYSAWDVFDGADIGGAAGSITLSITNVGAVIRNLRKLILTAKGGTLLNKNGGFIVWKPADFAIVEAFYQANGFVSADDVLQNGVKIGFTRGGFTHYVSNFLAGGRGAAGVKKVLKVGILKSTYGDLLVDAQDPGSLRGTGFRLAADYGVKTFNFAKSLLFDMALV